MMLPISQFMLAALTLLVVGATGAPTPPVWGGGPQWSVQVAVNDATSAGPPYSFNYSYNALLNVSMLEHGQGQHDEMCAGITGAPKTAGLPCTVIHASDSWSYIQFPTASFCCKCSPDVGIVSQHWLDVGGEYL
jgi:hypothetical protein